VCCSVLQCVAVCCSVLQCVAVYCSVLQCVVSYTYESCHAHSTCCSVLQCNVSRNESCHACKIKSHHAYKWRHNKKISWVTSYLELMLVRARNLPCNPAEYVTWLIHMCDMSHWYVRHYLLMRIPCLLLVVNMAHSYALDDSTGVSSDSF